MPSVSPRLIKPRSELSGATALVAMGGVSYGEEGLDGVNTTPASADRSAAVRSRPGETFEPLSTTLDEVLCGARALAEVAAELGDASGARTR